MAQNQEPTAIHFEPATEELKTAVDDLRAHLKEMRRILIMYSISDTGEERQWKEQWVELLAKGRPIHDKMLSAAVAEFRAEAGETEAIGQMLFRNLEKNVEADRFEGMLEVGTALLEKGYPSEDIPRMLAMTAFGMNEFDMARPFLDKMVEMGAASDQLMKLRNDLDIVKKEWERELELREQDAAGEPLPRVLLKTTKGNIEVELFENQAPESVANFISLIESGFYDHHTFHRVLQHFMAQTGCPNGDGSGNAGYEIYGEMDKPDARKFFRGSLGVALAPGNRDSGGSQFFITFLPTPHLNNDYTAFGRVIHGMDVLANLERIDPDKKDKKEGEAEGIPDELIEIEILFKRDHEYIPNKVQSSSETSTPQ